ncbi:MAG TPA: fatty acid desaturase [Methylomirabilota bacterium]|jgi:fatty acid desaturase|nr:fatty acid desaturase [Methylomirabilota bacterium]
MLTAGDLLTLPELRRLRALSAWRGAALVAHAWLVIAAAMVLYAVWPAPLTLLVAIVIVAGRQLGLVVLMHEAGHWLLFPAQPWNNRVGRWLCAAPIFADLPRYRRLHHLHHRHTQQPDDPDLNRAPRAPMARGALASAVLHDLGGLTALGHVLASRPWRADASRPWRRLGSPLVANAALLTGLAIAGHARLYLVLWLLPLATVYQLLVRVRDVAEHGLVGDRDDPLRNTRTTRASLLTRALVAPYWVNHHLEHHALVFVPCWKLADAHALLLAKGHGPSMELAPGYAAVLRRLVTTQTRR